MSVTARFDGPPTTRNQATLYQHAQQVMKLADDARAALGGLDNIDHVDLNSAKGTVITTDAHVKSITFAPAAVGAMSLEQITGELHEGPEVKMKAQIFGLDQGARVSYSESASEKRYQGSGAVGFCFKTGPITVVQDRASGALAVEQKNAFPYLFDSVSTGIAKQQTFSPDGPEDLESVKFYRYANDVMETFNKSIASLKGMDDGPRDLNPDPGIVVVAGFQDMESDNWQNPSYVSPYTIPTDAHLLFDPASGQAREMKIGFGDKDVMTYQRQENGAEHFSRELAMGFSEVLRQPDGGMTFKVHDSTRKEFQHRMEAQQPPPSDQRSWGKRVMDWLVI